MIRETPAAIWAMKSLKPEEKTMIPNRKFKTVICKDCEKVQDLNFDEGKNAKLAMKLLCFECDFWHDLIALKDHVHSVRVDGHHYFIGDEETRQGDPQGNGFGGSDHVVKFFDGRTLATNNLWFNGKVPARYADKLEDNAVFAERVKKAGAA